MRSHLNEMRSQYRDENRHVNTHKWAGPVVRMKFKIAIWSYFEQLSINIVKAVSQFYKMSELQNSHSKQDELFSYFINTSRFSH